MISWKEDGWVIRYADLVYPNVIPPKVLVSKVTAHALYIPQPWRSIPSIPLCS